METQRKETMESRSVEVASGGRRATRPLSAGRSALVGLLLTGLTAVLAAPWVQAQGAGAQGAAAASAPNPVPPCPVADQIVFGAKRPAFQRGSSTSLYNAMVVRFDRRLRLLGMTPLNGSYGLGYDYQFSGLAVGSDGRIWTDSEAANLNEPAKMGKYLFTILPDGSLRSIHLSNYRISSVAASRDGGCFVWTYTTAPSFAPVERFTSDGMILWTNGAPNSLLVYDLPFFFVPDASGNAWTGGQGWVNNETVGRVNLFSAADGSVLRTIVFPKVGTDTWGSGINFLQPRPGGGVVAVLVGGNPLSINGLATTDHTGVLSFVPQTPVKLWRLRVAADAQKVYSFSRTPAGAVKGLMRVDVATGAVETEWPLKGTFASELAIGPTGEEVYVLQQKYVGPSGIPRSNLVKLSLVTGQQSFVRLYPKDINLPYFTINGDPTAHILATVVIPDVDSDFDGTPNLEEVLAGYHPFDYESRPGGPKVYVSFPTPPVPGWTVLRVDLYDPDGVMDPQHGLDLARFSVSADHLATFGELELLPGLWPHLLQASVSADGKTATLDFDLTPYAFPEDTGITASIRDGTLARGWDWHRIP